MASLNNPPVDPCVSIPENAVHSVSVSLPTWSANVSYEEGDPAIANKMKCGYPRFKIHYKIEELVNEIESQYKRDGERAMIFSTNDAARRCREFIQIRHPNASVRVLNLSCPKSQNSLDVHIYVTFFPADLFSVAKQYWQHTGEGISSRKAQYFYEKLQEQQNKIPALDSFPIQAEEDPSIAVTHPQEIFIEERFGRYLSTSLADKAKPALKTRISDEVNRRNRVHINAEDVYLYPTGMAAIFNSYRAIREVQNSDEKDLKAVCFGFPYTDTLKILQKWGPGAHFFPFGDDDGDLVKLEAQLEKGEINISCVFCEVPSNPLLNTPNIIKLHELALKYKFLLVIDDTVGNMANVDCISYADICVSSLTKLFSGDCNVMAGDLVLNPNSPFYHSLKQVLEKQFVDALWAEDAIYLERNSRDFFARNQRINHNAEAIVNSLLNYRETSSRKMIKDVNYPKCSPSRGNYDAIKYPDGGYGGLLSVVFYEPEAAIAFFDTLFIAKGPSLGTNFTLGCPYTIIAHYAELDYVNTCGLDTHLVRLSIGLEETDDLIQRFKVALDAAEHAVSD